MCKKNHIIVMLLACAMFLLTGCVYGEGNVTMKDNNIFYALDVKVGMSTDVSGYGANMFANGKEYTQMYHRWGDPLEFPGYLEELMNLRCDWLDGGELHDIGDITLEAMWDEKNNEWMRVDGVWSVTMNVKVDSGCGRNEF